MKTYIFSHSPRLTLQIIFRVILGGYILGLVVYLLMRISLGGLFWWLALLNDFAVVLFLPLPLVVILCILFRFRWLVIIGFGLALIISFWFAPYFIPKTRVSSGGSVLSVVTFNVWGQNSRLDDVQIWLRGIAADVVVIQEIPERYAIYGIPELDDIYPYQRSQPTSERLWGNLLLSRYPILSEDRLPGEGIPAQHRFTIEFDEQLVAIYNVLAIYNVHLAMPIGNSSRSPVKLENFIVNTALSYDHSTRNSEIESLLLLLQNEPHPFIVAGDFNMSEQSVIYSEIAKNMGDAFREAGSGWGGSWPISIVDDLPAFMPPLIRVDYIWHSKHFWTLEAYKGPQLGSDHLPFYASFELKNETQHFSKN